MFGSTTQFDVYHQLHHSDRILYVSFSVQFMVLLILRHAVPIFATGSDNFSFPLFVVRETSSKSANCQFFLMVTFLLFFVSVTATANFRDPSPSLHHTESSTWSPSPTTGTLPNCSWPNFCNHFKTYFLLCHISKDYFK